MERKKWFLPADLILLGAIVIAAALCFVLTRRADSASAAQIRVNGEIVETIRLRDLTETETRTVGGCVIAVGPEGARFLEADCPDRICVQSGLLDRPGRTAACVPNGVTVAILGESDLDAISY